MPNTDKNPIAKASLIMVLILKIKNYKTLIDSFAKVHRFEIQCAVGVEGKITNTMIGVITGQHEIKAKDSQIYEK